MATHKHTDLPGLDTRTHTAWYDGHTLHLTWKGVAQGSQVWDALEAQELADYLGEVLSPIHTSERPLCADETCWCRLLTRHFADPALEARARYDDGRSLPARRMDILAEIELAGYDCKPAGEIADRDLLYDAQTPDQPAQVIGTPWDENGENILVEVNRRGLEEVVTYKPGQLVFVKSNERVTGFAASAARGLKGNTR